MNELTIIKITMLFERTMRNAEVYLQNDKTRLFLNEIGVAKGLLYALQAEDILPNSKYMNVFCNYIEMEKSLLEREKTSLF